MLAPEINQGKCVQTMAMMFNFCQAVNGIVYPLNSGASNPVETIAAV